MTDTSQWIGQLGGSIAAHEIGSVVGKLPVGGGNAVVVLIVLHRVRVRLGLRAGGGRATRAVQAHCCGLWGWSKETDDEVALRGGQFDRLVGSRGEHRRVEFWSV